MNDENPYRSPHPEEPRVEPHNKARFHDSPDPVMADVAYGLPIRLYLILALAAAFGWIWLAMEHPMIWAIVNVILIDLGLGLLMTKVVFRFERPFCLWGLVPVFGTGWLLVLWSLFKGLA